MKYLFIIPSINDSHFKNRIIEFVERNLDVAVYGFSRSNQKIPNELPYKFEILGELRDENYKERISLYIKCFRELGKKYKRQDVCFYLCGLDIAMFFHYINPHAKYIYEECDLIHTYMGNLKYPLEWIDKKIIKHSSLTVTTSEGFIDYHFNGKRLENVVLVENKLNPSILDFPQLKKKCFSKDAISIGFVGGPRFDSVYNFIDAFCRNFPNGIFHVYGGPIPEQFETLKKYDNCIFHGFFKNPSDLSSIYESIDLVIATYDTKYENVRYAEPNKIYESIYFETPIVVSSGTFLAKKVNRLGIGCDIDAMDENAVISFIKNLTKDNLNEWIENTRKIDKNDLLSINDNLFAQLEKIENQF